jgi:hypothetical protein
MDRPCISYLLNDHVYTYEAASAAAHLFTDHCTVTVTKLGEATKVDITPLPVAAACVVEEFLNYVLGLSVEQILKQV